MHKLKLEPLAKEVETERLPRVGAKEQLITVTVPLTDLFARSYCYFYKLHGCTVEQTNSVVSNMRLYQFTFPLGTQWRGAGASHGYLLLMKYPDLFPRTNGKRAEP
jgi:hypothetical protein